ncbi:hypothetical protein ColTof4_14037 [Colletotrichum tofieldiae]|nr:hypothetical protein ColTof3_14672 [Colletotrichum tofieldiae]GKT81614.1 hypothetical protein ColTof4_14037 [Colletotrichum tofieldiae]GKT97588.1 hypothetical protein Ct61P_15438 [Colletotrichum tofieldiae]
MAAYPHAEKRPVAEKLKEQVPLLEHARKSAKGAAAAQNRTNQHRTRQEGFVRRLNEAWHGEGWKLPEPFRSNSKSKGQGFKDLSYLCSITATASEHGLDLPSLWQPGGVLFDTMTGDPRIWTVETAKNALGLLNDRLEQEEDREDQDYPQGEAQSDSGIPKPLNSDAANDSNLEAPENGRVASPQPLSFQAQSPISLLNLPVEFSSPAPDDSSGAVSKDWHVFQGTDDPDDSGHHEHLEASIEGDSVKGSIDGNAD